MRKGTKIIIWIGSAVVGSLLIIALILGMITVRPLNKLGDEYETIVINGFESYEYSSTSRDALIADALKTVKFSVLRATLQGKFSYKIKGVEKTNADDEQERVKHTVSEIKTLKPVNGEFMLLLTWDKPQTNPNFMTDEVDVMDNGEIVNKAIEIVFDRLIIVIPERNGQVQDVKLYPYLDSNIDNQSIAFAYNEDGFIGSEYYNIYEFTARMYTSKLYDMFVENDEFIPGAYKEEPKPDGV